MCTPRESPSVGQVWIKKPDNWPEGRQSQKICLILLQPCSGKQTHSEGQCRQWSAVYYTGGPKAASSYPRTPTSFCENLIYSKCVCPNPPPQFPETSLNKGKTNSSSTESCGSQPRPMTVDGAMLSHVRLFVTPWCYSHAFWETISEGQCRQWSAVYYNAGPKAESPLSQGPRPALVKIFYTPCVRVQSHHPKSLEAYKRRVNTITITPSFMCYVFKQLIINKPTVTFQPVNNQ